MTSVLLFLNIVTVEHRYCHWSITSMSDIRNDDDQLHQVHYPLKSTIRTITLVSLSCRL